MSTATVNPTGLRIPPLENGDRLSRREFYRHWGAMPQLKFAEQIDGEVYMRAAARREGHAAFLGELQARRTPD